MPPDIASHMRIRCAKCGKMVDEIEIEFDPYWDAYVIRVFCHGEQQKMMVTRREIDEFNGGLLLYLLSQIGEAFVSTQPLVTGETGCAIALPFALNRG